MYTSLRRIPHAIFWLCICLCFRIRYDQDTSRYFNQVNFERYIHNFNIFFSYRLKVKVSCSRFLPKPTSRCHIDAGYNHDTCQRYIAHVRGCFGCVVALARARVISRVYELVASANAACTERGTLMRIAAMIEAHDRCASGRVCLRVCLCHATQGRHHIKAESTRCYGPNGRIDVRRCAQYLLTP